MNSARWKDDAVQLCSEWLDTDDEMGEASVDQNSPLDGRLLGHVADLQLIDALLTSMAPGKSEVKEDRIRRVMQAVTLDSPTTRASVRLPRLYSFAAVAACLMIACTIFWLQLSRETRANEVLLEISEVSLNRTDRVYDLRRRAAGAEAHDERRGRLYLRGVEGFVVECGDAVFGRHDGDFWVVSPDRPVVLADDFDWIDAVSLSDKRELSLLKDLSIESRHLPLMQLSSVVELLQHDYDVSLRRGLPQRQHRLDRLVGTRRSAISDLPTSIHLWFDADSKTVYRVEFDWAELQNAVQTHSLILELAPDQNVPVDWYHHEAHHADDRPVRRISSRN